MSVQSLAIVVPAYNEEASLESAVLSIASAAGRCIPDFEVIVVNDGSRDRTGEILDRIARTHPKVRAIHHPENRMIGGSLLSGLRAARASHMILVPVDNPLPEDRLRAFLAAADSADIAVGYRTERKGYRAWMSLGSRLYHGFCVLLFGVDLKDFMWISLYDREKILALHPRYEGIAIFPELLAKAASRGLRLAEVECPMVERKTGRATVSRLSRIAHLFLETLRLWAHVRFGRW